MPRNRKRSGHKIRNSVRAEELDEFAQIPADLPWRRISTRVPETDGRASIEEACDYFFSRLESHRNQIFTK